MNDEEPGAVINSLIIYIVEGSIAAAVNVPLAIAMLANHNLRKRRELHVIMGICIVDSMFGLAFILSAVNRLEIIKENYYTGIPLIPRWKCSTRYYVHFLTVAYQLQRSHCTHCYWSEQGVLLIGVLALTVAIDRLLAIVTPIKYLKFDCRYNIIIAAGPYVVAAAGTTINAIIALQDDTSVPSFCLTGRAVAPGFYYYILLLRIGCVSISALAYVFIIIQLNKHFARIEKTQAACRESHQLRSIRRSTITLGLSTASAFLFLLIPDIIKYLGVLDYSRSYITTLHSLSMTNVILNAFIFAYRHKEILTSFKLFLFAILRHGSVKEWSTGFPCKVAPAAKH